MERVKGELFLELMVVMGCRASIRPIWSTSVVFSWCGLLFVCLWCCEPNRARAPPLCSRTVVPRLTPRTPIRPSHGGTIHATRCFRNRIAPYRDSAHLHLWSSPQSGCSREIDSTRRRRSR